MKIIDNIRWVFENLSRWVSYLPVLWKVHDFDYSSILSVERYQIKRVRDSISRYQSHTNWKRDVASMNLALRLLDIIEEDGEATISKGGDFVPHDDKTWEMNPDTTWELNRYVNVRNAKRFTTLYESRFEDTKTGAMWRDHLRVEKAWHIYHKLRQYKLKNWWD